MPIHWDGTRCCSQRVQAAAKAAQLQIDNYCDHYPAVATAVTCHAAGKSDAMAVATQTTLLRIGEIVIRMLT